VATLILKEKVMPRKLENVPAVEVADAMDIGSVQIYNHGTGSADVDFVIEALYGKETDQLDPNLDASLGVKLFDQFTHRTILNAKFGLFMFGVMKAVAAGKVTKEDAMAFHDAAIAKFLESDVPLANRAIDLAKAASEELAEVGIILQLPTTAITR
jgi:hypothetical protein